MVEGLENVLDFNKAWHLQKDRRRGKHLPTSVWAQRRLLYGEACCLGAQVERLLSVAPSHQVLTLVLDDIRADPRKEYLRVLDFLGVHDDGRLNFSVQNPAKTLRVSALRHLYRPVALNLHRLVALKTKTGVEGNFGLWTRNPNVEPNRAAENSAVPRDGKRSQNIL